MDEVIRSQYHYQPHTDTLTHVRTQPTEGLILERNADLRKDNAMADLSFGRQVASIPLNMWDAAIRSGFALNHPDNETAERELFRYLQSDAGRACLVRDRP